MTIIYSNPRKLADEEGYYKGYRTDVKVIINNKTYCLYITDFERLRQDYESEI